MIPWSAVAQHPLSLTCAAIAGAWMSAVNPALAPFMSAVAKVFVGLLQMAALPLMIVAIVFGLKRWIELPAPITRVLKLIGAGSVLVLFAALMALLLAEISLQIWRVNENDRATLGSLLDEAEQVLEFALLAPSQGAPPLDSTPLITSNVFAALSSGALPSILIIALIFGLALNKQEGSSALGMATQLEAIYRTLESLISKLNLLLPFAAWAMAGYAIAGLSAPLISAMRAMLIPLALVSASLIALCIIVLNLASKAGLWSTVLAMSRPICISLLSPSPASLIPAYIDALSNRLGFSRGIVELLIPTLPVFLRLGEVVYFTTLLVFLCGIYQHPLVGAEWLIVLAAAILAAAMAIHLQTGSLIMAAAIGFSWLELPVEAILPHLLVLEVFSQGLRQAVSGLCTCALIAVSTADLESGPRIDKPWGGGPAESIWQIRLSGSQSWAMMALIFLALLFVFLMGMGLSLTGSR